MLIFNNIIFDGNLKHSNILKNVGMFFQRIILFSAWLHINLHNKKSRHNLCCSKICVVILFSLFHFSATAEFLE